jgi:DNA polymerase III alpha subunit|tara:strand:+ start:603 stop:1076 length:474 start_codon:yes stop_codon:yes gene_type:complete
MTTTYTEKTGIELLYRMRYIDDVPFDDEVVQQFNAYSTELQLPTLTNNGNWSKEFNIPEHYKGIDVEAYIRGLIPREGGSTTESPLLRVEQELAEFRARNLFPVLQLLIYIVDTLRKNNLVWGVGRGSCVASYCLFLIGIHKVNSLEYNLDLREFLK